jgi:ABC-2 type transport system ATP-binding protein
MIRAVSLTKDFGSIRAVDRVSFAVEKGEILGFLGPNGAGKSTTMKMLTGFLAPTAGTAEIGGHDIGGEPLAAKRLFGYLPETGPLYPEMTVRQFLRFVADVRGLKGAAAAAALDRVRGICHLDGVWGQPLETLSKGFRQRVGLAQAVLHDPPVLILDEPTDGLDPNQKGEVRRLIRGMAGEKAIILSTHILEEVEAMCTRVSIIDRGRIVVDERPEALKRRHPDHGALEVAFAGDNAPDQARLAEGAPLSGIERVGDEWILRPAGDAPLNEWIHARAAERGWTLRSVRPLPVDLEAVFAKLTRDESQLEKEVSA